MKFSVKFGLLDMIRFKNLVNVRKRHIQEGASTPITVDPVNTLAQTLHPLTLDLVISKVTIETPSTKTFRLVSADGLKKVLPFFRAGQYLSIKTRVEGSAITRPYTISSSPNDALAGFYEITLRKKDGGFLSEYAFSNWNEGTRLTASSPCGFFYHERLRDTTEILALAGGSGITPFRSMIKDIVENGKNLKLTLIYGTKSPNDIIFAAELGELAQKAPEKIAVHVVCSEPDSCWEGPTGFLTAECIKNIAGDLKDKTVFICGPQLMYRMLDNELKVFGLPARRIRREVMGETADVTVIPGYPKDLATKTFSITVRSKGSKKDIPALASETVLVALERAKFAPPSQCRSGECGWCRTRLIRGDVFVNPENDGRRIADAAYGYFHPCSAYPVSDLEIVAPQGL
ncbi:MAG TPA: iron-sulfur cluster-binding domain-containing protein [Desulfomonilia bacterium]